jgi:hypothetical protein
MRSFWMLVLGFALSLGASSAEGDATVAKEPGQIEVKASDEIFAEHFKMIVAQITRKDIKPKWVLAQKPATLKDAFRLMRERIEFKGFRYIAEKDGWFLFSNMQLAGSVLDLKGAELALAFHNGYAVKKDSEKVYYFGFW